MNARFTRIFASKFMMWMLFAVVGTYFLVSIHAPQGQSRFAPLMSGDVKTFFKSLYMPRVKLGIDLQGGTYLVLSVGVEKAIENRLIKEKNILKTFSKRRSCTAPIRRRSSANKAGIFF